MLSAPMSVASAKLQPEARYRNGYVPKVIEINGRLQIVSPDTPYVAAAGRDRLYFIDTRHEPDSAAHIKQQIEWASVALKSTYIKVDELEINAEVREEGTNEVLFTFDPEYVKVMFAPRINRRNPDIKLPELTDEGEHIVTYDIGESLLS